MTFLNGQTEQSGRQRHLLHRDTSILPHKAYYLLYISKLELIKASLHDIFNSISLYLKGIQMYPYVGHSYKNIVSYIKVVTI